MKQVAKSAQTAFSLAAVHRRAWFLGTGYVLVCILAAVFTRTLLNNLLAVVLNDETFSHIPFVLAASAYFLFMEREQIFGGTRRRSGLSATIALAGAAALAVARMNPFGWSSSNQISLVLFGFVLVWTGAFGIFFGENAMRAARFPLLFLWFAIPIPRTLLLEIVGLLQRGSAEAVNVIFLVFHTPAVRQGFEFALPGVTIRVAEECSGIRSTLALVMASVLAGHLWLRSGSRTVLLCLAAVPISILKNALRIAALSWLAIYVDPRFLTGAIHHQYGGILFFGVGLLMMGIVLTLLERLRFQIPFGKRQIPSA
jgi:exosortase